MAATEIEIKMTRNETGQYIILMVMIVMAIRMLHIICYWNAKQAELTCLLWYIHLYIYVCALIQ